MTASMEKDPQWIMPRWYNVCVMMALILENSPRMAINEEDPGKMSAKATVNILDRQ